MTLIVWSIHDRGNNIHFTLNSHEPENCYPHKYKNNFAATCDFQQCGILTSVDSEEPVQLPFKLRNSK